MKKEEKLKKWEKEVMFPALNQAVSTMEKALQRDIEQILEEVCSNIEELFNQAVKQQKEGQRAADMIFHLMRRDILKGICQYWLSVYDKSWYLKRGEEIGVLNSRFIYDYYDAFWKEILMKSGVYTSVFSVAELEFFAMRQLEIFHYYFVEVLRYAMNRVTEGEAYYKLKKEEKLELQSGTYYEACDKLYQQETEKDYGKWKRQFLNGEEKKFCFADLKGIDLKGVSAVGVDLRYADLRKSNLQGIDLESSILQGTRFQRANLKQANFEKAILNYACFEYADLQGACFDKAVTAFDTMFYTIKMQSAYQKISFRKSCLKEASFRGANLRYVDFREADLEGADFTEAFLEQSIFSQNQMKQIDLTNEQKQQIRIDSCL